MFYEFKKRCKTTQHVGQKAEFKSLTFKEINFRRMESETVGCYAGVKLERI